MDGYIPQCHCHSWFSSHVCWVLFVLALCHSHLLLSWMVIPMLLSVHDSVFTNKAAFQFFLHPNHCTFILSVCGLSLQNYSDTLSICCLLCLLVVLAVATYVESCICNRGVTTKLRPYDGASIFLGLSHVLTNHWSRSQSYVSNTQTVHPLSGKNMTSAPQLYVSLWGSMGIEHLRLLLGEKLCWLWTCLIGVCTPY